MVDPVNNCKGVPVESQDVLSVDSSVDVPTGVLPTILEAFTDEQQAAVRSALGMWKHVLCDERQARRLRRYDADPRWVEVFPMVEQQHDRFQRIFVDVDQAVACVVLTMLNKKHHGWDILYDRSGPRIRYWCLFVQPSFEHNARVLANGKWIHVYKECQREWVPVDTLVASAQRMNGAPLEIVIAALEANRHWTLSEQPRKGLCAKWSPSRPLTF